MTSEKWQYCFPPHPYEWVQGKVIGSGSFGTVHLAVDTSTGSLFVVKSATSDAGAASLDNESRILRHLDSPYIVRCIGRDHRSHSLFFEYMGGGSLSDLMHKLGGALHENLVRLYTRQILLALDYLHRNHVVHSDVKCKNVLVGATGTVKLSDFGCAQKMTGPAPCRGCGGTPLWMAPEVLRSRDVDFPADIWSLGCTVIEMATGRPPWDGSSDHPMAAIMEIAEGNGLPKFPQHLSSEGLDFLSRCLDRNPLRRWSTAELLDHPFVTIGSRKMGDVAMSPTSILDVGGNYYDSEDDEDDEEFARRTPLPTKNNINNNIKVSRSEYESENYSETSSDGWITVRKR